MEKTRGGTITDASGLIGGLWKYYKVKLRFRSRCYGGVPKNKDMIRGWLEAKMGSGGDTDKLIARTEEEIVIAVDDAEKQSWCGFKIDVPHGLYIEGRQVKACLKESANILREKIGIIAFKARLAERVFVLEDRIFLDRQEPDGSVERPIHVMTRQGPMTALKKADYVERAAVDFTLKALDSPMVMSGSKNRVPPSVYLPVILELAQEMGLGADRSQENGKFEVVEFEETEPEEID